MINAPSSAPPWAHELTKQINQELDQNTPVRLPSFTVADLPSASRWVKCWIYVSDETGGAVPAFSDGTDWRRCTDRVIAS